MAEETPYKKPRVTRAHGLSYMPEYRVWQTMRLRCTNPENQAYASYGGRGIRVCAWWIDSPGNFLADMGVKPTPKHEIDRIDNDGGYTCGHCDDCKSTGAPANCRWATRSQNDRNRRSNRMVEFRGETRALVEWCEILKLPYMAIAKRFSDGVPAEEALTVPVKAKRPNGSPSLKVKKREPVKYPPELVASIREEKASGTSVAELSEKHGITKKYLRKLISGERRGGVKAAA